MGGSALNQKDLENAVVKALETHFSRQLDTSNNPRDRFYDKFQRAADDHDRDFAKKCGGDLNTTLIFSGLFSAVASAFIVDVQAQIKPDYTQLTYNVLMVIANSRDLQVLPEPNSDSHWTGPPPALIHVQSILFSSLAVSLLAAFVAMLGKQWLNRYSADIRGSPTDRGRDRQRKMNGMSTWRFDVVMEILPMMLQAALLLLGYALYVYLSTIDSLVAWVIAAFTLFGVSLYGIIVVASILSYDCPFQTPFTIFIRFVVRLDNRHRRYLKRSWRCIRSLFSWEEKQQRPGSGGPRHMDISSKFDGGEAGDHIELAMYGQYENSPPLFEETNWEGHVLDSNCISWMSDKSMDDDVAPDIAKFIPEVVWHSGIRTAPLEKLYDKMAECFDYQSRGPVVNSGLKQRAYLYAKALLHVAIQRKFMGNRSDEEAYSSISCRHRNVGPKDYGGDSDLESTLGIIDHVFGAGGFNRIPWEKFSFTDSHHAWLGYILLYRACYLIGNGEPLADDIKGFVLYSLRLNPLPPAPIVLDCLFIVGLLLGIRLDAGEKGVDESQKFRSRIDRIYKKLATTFGNAKSATNEIDRALEVLEFIAPLSHNNITTKSYHLFHVIMQAPVSGAYSEEKKWQASRFALLGAYPWGKKNGAPVDDPQDILTFLNHHFELAAKGEDQSRSIGNALYALAYASSPTTIEALKNFDPTRSSFVLGIRRAFKEYGDRMVALRVLPLIGDKWFNTGNQTMKPDEMKDLCEDWASAADGVGPLGPDDLMAALAVLFRMINSDRWRPHIPSNTWKLLEHFLSAPHDSEPLKRCLENPGLTRAILEVGNQDAALFWPTILWVKYKELSGEVRKQLEEVMKAAPRDEVNRYLGVVTSGLEVAEKALASRYGPYSTRPEAIILRNKIENLKEGKVLLLRLLY